MDKLLLIYGCVLMCSSAIAEEQQGKSTVAIPAETERADTTGTFENTFTALNINVGGKRLVSAYYVDQGCFELNLNEIEFIEDESEVDLGFDTSAYLPEGFDPYKPYFDLGSIIYLESEVGLQLGFDTLDYLPAGFDPYSEALDVNSINYVYVEEEESGLGFETKDYLPEGFSPYEAHIDFDNISYAGDFEVDLGLGSNSEYGLPQDFDLYNLSVASIDYIENGDEELDFKTTPHLPKNFDPCVLGQTR